MRTIAIINLKGGVAKTASSVSLSYILSQRGYKVLLLDNDKQGDASRWMDRRDKYAQGTDRIMLDRNPDMQQLIQRTDYANLDIITANLNLLDANNKVLMDSVRPQQNRIKKALQLVEGKYDFCIIDNAPDVNVSTINALAAANDVLIPMEIDDNTTEGFEILEERAEMVKEDWNPNLENLRCFITKYDKYNEAHAEGLVYLANLEYPLMNTVIRLSRKMAKSTFARCPISVFSPRSAAAMDYEYLADEYLEMIAGKGGKIHG